MKNVLFLFVGLIIASLIFFSCGNEEECTVPQTECYEVLEYGKFNFTKIGCTYRVNLLDSNDYVEFEILDFEDVRQFGNACAFSTGGRGTILLKAYYKGELYADLLNRPGCIDTMGTDIRYVYSSIDFGNNYTLEYSNVFPFLKDIEGPLLDKTEYRFWLGVSKK